MLKLKMIEMESSGEFSYCHPPRLSLLLPYEFIEDADWEESLLRGLATHAHTKQWAPNFHIE